MNDADQRSRHSDRSELMPVDWVSLEPHYRAGIRSISAISQQFGVSRQAIAKHARKYRWTRDLRNRVLEVADRQLAAVAVAQVAVTPKELLDEEDIVRAGGDQIALLQLNHRRDISRVQCLLRTLFADLEETSGPRGAELYAKVEGVFSDASEPSLRQVEQALAIIASLPTRVKLLRDLADALARLIGLERQAYGLNRDTSDDRPMVFIKDYTGRGDPDSPLGAHLQSAPRPQEADEARSRTPSVHPGDVKWHDSK